MNNPISRSRAYQTYKKLEEAKVLDRIPDRFDPNIMFSEDEDEGEETIKVQVNDSKLLLTPTNPGIITPKVHCHYPEENSTAIFNGIEGTLFPKSNTNKNNLLKSEIAKSSDNITEVKELSSAEAVKRNIPNNPSECKRSAIDGCFGANKISEDLNDISGIEVASNNGEQKHLGNQSKTPLIVPKSEHNVHSVQCDTGTISTINEPKPVLKVNAKEEKEDESTFYTSVQSHTAFAMAHFKPPMPRVMNKGESVKVNNKEYQILTELGCGASCKVYSALDQENKIIVAIKRVNLAYADTTLKNGYLQEMEYLKLLQGSNNVIRLFESEVREEEILLVMEKGDTDLAHLLSEVKRKGGLNSLMIKYYWLQMLNAVNEIHKQGIVHSDLKPANFLLVSGHLKLIDFGISSKIPSDMTSALRDTTVGTVNYMSPETIIAYDIPTCDDEKAVYKIGVKSDIWSLGCILYNMVYGHTPFQNLQLLAHKVEAITNPKYNIPFAYITDHLLLDVMKRCLERNLKMRASMSELLNHRYLAVEDCKIASPSDSANIIMSHIGNLTYHQLLNLREIVNKLLLKCKNSQN